MTPRMYRRFSRGAYCETVPGMQVLQDSLCGSSKVMLVCNLSPEAASAGETLSSLNFASRAAQVCPSCA